jgi:hypothetical protein
MTVGTVAVFKKDKQKPALDLIALSQLSWPRMLKSPRALFRGMSSSTLAL